MSAPGRPKSEYRSARREGTPVSPRAAMGHEGAPSEPWANTEVHSTKVLQ
jgi:hypothetical protein